MTHSRGEIRHQQRLMKLVQLDICFHLSKNKTPGGAYTHSQREIIIHIEPASATYHFPFQLERNRK